MGEGSLHAGSSTSTLSIPEGYFIIRKAGLNQQQNTAFWLEVFWYSNALKSQVMVEVGSNCWRPPGQSPLREQSHLEPVALDESRWLLSIFRDQDSTVSLGNLCHSSVTLKVLPDVQRDSCVSVCAYCFFSCQ